MTRLATAYEHRGDYTQAGDLLQRQLALEPWREDVQRQRMRVLALNGQRSAALQQYHACRRMLARDLEVEPEASTTELYEHIRTGALQPVSLDRANPYKGLRAFTEADAHDFFGRETFVERLLDAVYRQPLVAVLGPSGSGKSSVVYAGLLPRLRDARVVSGPMAANDMDVNWLICDLRPGNHPFQVLAEALSGLAESLAPTGERIRQGRPQEVANVLQTDRGALASMLDAIRNLAAQRYPQPCRMLLVIDQFEELYTLCPEPESRRAFIDCLLQLLAISPETAPGTAMTIVLTMRADFMGLAFAYRPFADQFQDASLILGPMHHQELQRAIEQPARHRQIAFESGLVTRVLQDVGDEPGTLPLLEFALALLWDDLAGDTLTHAAYEAIGEVTGALTSYAERVYDQLDTDEQGRAQRVLTRLVRPGEGTEDTRRRVARAELAETDWPLVQKLADARLVVTNREPTGQEMVEVVHEALIRSWSRLRFWMDADRAFHLWRQHLRGAWQQWTASDGDGGTLLRGGPLAEAETWMQRRGDDLGVSEQVFITASVNAEAARLEHERRQVQRLARTAAVSQSLNLATNARLALSERNTDLALALALEAGRIEAPPAQVQLALADAAYAPGTQRCFIGHDGAIMGLALSADGRWAISASTDETLILWDVSSGSIVRRFEGHGGAVHDVALSADGRWAMSGSTDGTLQLWDVSSGSIVRRFEGHGGAVHSLVLSADGHLAMSGSADESLLLWDVDSGSILRRYRGHGGAVQSVALSPDERTLLSGSADKGVILWDVKRAEPIYRFGGLVDSYAVLPREPTRIPQGHFDTVHGVAFGPDGRTALSVSSDCGVMFWNLVTGRAIKRYESVRTSLWGIALSPDQRSALIGSMDSRVVPMDLGEMQKMLILLGHTSRVRALCFGPDGRTALSGSDDGTLRLWDLHSGLEERRLAYNDSFVAVTLGANRLDGLAESSATEADDAEFSYDMRHLQAASGVDISPDGQMGLTGLWKGDIVLWDYASGREIRRLQGHTEMMYAGTFFRPDGQTVVSGSGHIFAESSDNTLRLWDVATGAERQCFEGHTGSLWSISVSPDGRYVASGAVDGTLRLWNLEQDTSRLLHDFTPQWTRYITYSPDGLYVLCNLTRGQSDDANETLYSLRLIDVATGQEVRRFIGHREVVPTSAFSPDGQQVLSGGQDQYLILWDASSGQIIYRLDHYAAVTAMAFSPGGGLAAIGNMDGDISLLEVNSGTVLRHFHGHSGSVMAVTFRPDGRTVLSAAVDDTVREWRVDMSQEEVLHWVSTRRYVLDLTPEQRRRYGIEFD